MKLAGHGTHKAIIVTLTGKDSRGILSYLVIPDIAVPVRLGKPQPEKKWYRATILRIIGPQIGGWHMGNTQHLLETEYKSLCDISSPKDSPVEDERIKAIIRNKVLPWQLQRPYKGDEWSEAQMTQRATTIHAYSFDFPTKVEMGGNLMGVTLYLDANGQILSKWEAMLHVD